MLLKKEGEAVEVEVEEKNEGAEGPRKKGIVSKLMLWRRNSDSDKFRSVVGLETRRCNMMG